MSVYSQGRKFEKGINDSYKQIIQQVANKNEFTYLLVEYDFHLVFIEKYDSLGTQLIKQQLSPGQGFSSFISHRMVITNDNNIWISGYGLDACDVLSAHDHVVVYNSNLQFINAFTRSADPFTASLHYLAMSPISDTSVAVNFRNTDSSWVEILGPSSQQILANVNTPDLFGFGKNSQFHVLGHTINKIYGIDNQGVLQDSISLPGPFREIGTWNDTIIVLGYNTLFKVSPDLQTFTTHNIPNLSNFTRLKIDNSGVRFISGNFNLAVHYLDHQLNIQSLTTVPVFDPNNTTYDFDQTVSVAKNFVLTEYESVRFATYSLDQTQNNIVNRSDIAVLDLEIVDSYATQHLTPTVYTIDAKANVLIKNLGPNTVDSVRLNHYVSNFTFCGHVVNSNYFGNLNLAPGDSMWVDFGWFGPYIANYPFTGHVDRTYCVYSSNPNGIVDLNVANDEFCEYKSFGYAELDESNVDQFVVYPNPTSSFIHIEFKDEFIGNYVIIDQMGRIVQSGEVSNTISLVNLKNGIYHLTLIHENGKISAPKKVIKQ